MHTRNLIVWPLVLLAIAAAGYYRLLPPRLAQAPDISLLSVDGEALRLPAYRGRPVLVTFWSTTCPSCVREIPHLSELYRDLAPQGLEIIGITTAYDPPNRVLEMRESHDIPYPVALDMHADAAHAFGNVRVTPTSFLIAPDGRVVLSRVGRLNMTGLRREILAMIATQVDSRKESGLSDP
ncbi:MAG: TlpA disulfide reductase family protein [Gammaproteobacteria bacterium]|jgi:peroxiredoxin